MLSKDATVLQGVLDSTQDYICVLDLSRHVVLINKRFEELFGDQRGRPCCEKFALKYRCPNCISLRALETGKPARKHRRHQNAIYEIHATPLYDSDGNPVGTVEVFRDITSQYLQQDALRLQNKRLLREANLAARMQRELFLSQGEPDGRVQVNSRYLPASSLGGDMFGCLKQPDGRLCFYIADVSGHGMAAAMITLTLASVLRGTKVVSAVQLLNRARELFLSMVRDEQLYVSMFVAILDPETGELIWANAGLNAIPLLKNGDTLHRLYSPAMPLCNWQEHIQYKEHQAHMQPGGSLLLYTDGLLDTRSSTLDERQLEAHKMQELPGELLYTLERKILQNHEDDVCMLHVLRE